MENKKVELLVKIQFLRYDVTKWRHNVKILIDLESTHQGLSYEVLHDMVPSILKFDLGVSKFQLAARPMIVKVDQPQKLVSWVADYIHTKFGVDLITATQKIRVLLTPYFYHNLTLTFDLEMMPSISWLPLRDNYTRDVIWMYGLL
jgi:hypothetical protein